MGKAELKKSDVVCGIERAMLDEGSIDAALDKLDIVPAPKATVDDKVKLLVDEFERQEKQGQKMVDCDNCDAPSEASAFAACPFCGVGEEGAASEPEPSDDGGGETPDEDGPGDPDGAASKFEGVPAGDAPDDTDTASLALDVPPSPVAGQVLVPKKRGRKKSSALAVAQAELPAMPPVEGQIEIPLDAEVREIKELIRAASDGGWTLARRLMKLDVSGVWKTRKTAEGKVAYKNFDEFVQAEIGMTRRWWQDLVEVASAFTEEEVKQIGVSKLRVVIQADQNAKEKILGELKAGASRRQAEKLLGRKPGEGEQRAPGRKSKVAKGEPRADGKVTVALVPGRTKVPFFVKQAKRDAEDGGKPAKRLADTPWARYPLRNDAELLVTLGTNAKGEIVGTFEVRRVDPAGK